MRLSRKPGDGSEQIGSHSFASGELKISNRPFPISSFTHATVASFVEGVFNASRVRK